MAYSLLQGQYGSWQTVAFSSVLPLDGRKAMPQATVSGPVSFTFGAARVVQGECYATLIADGVNAPTVSGGLEHNSSSGYDNRSGAINVLQAWWDGVRAWFSWSQAVSISDLLPPSLVSASAFGQTVALTYSESLNTTAPATSAWSFTKAATSWAVSSVFIFGNTVVLTMATAAAVGESISFNYTPPGSNPVQDSAGNAATSLSGQAATNLTTSTAPLRFTALVGITEGGAGPNYTYTGSASIGASHASSPSLTLASGADGFWQASASITGSATGPVVAVRTSSAAGAYSVAGTYGFFRGATVGANYSVITNGSPGSAANAVPYAAGDVMRVERVGTSLVAKVSKDNGVNWQTIHTWSGITGQLWPHLDLDGSGTSIASLVASGLTSPGSSLRFTALVGISESGTAPSYVYTGTAALGASHASGPSLTLASGADGYWQTTPTISGGATGPVVAFRTSSAAGAYSVAGTYGFFRGAAVGATYSVITNGSPGSATTALAYAAGDIMRLERVGTNLLAKVSKDNEATWTTVHTWTGITGQLWPHLDLDTSSTSIANLTALGLT